MSYKESVQTVEEMRAAYKKIVAESLKDIDTAEFAINATGKPNTDDTGCELTMMIGGDLRIISLALVQIISKLIPQDPMLALPLLGAIIKGITTAKQNRELDKFDNPGGEDIEQTVKSILSSLSSTGNKH